MQDPKLPSPSFTHRNPSFVCENCGQEVPSCASGCRNHCPFCLHSKHVDVMPGDRANPCQGLMKAVGYELSGKKGIVLIFRCLKCNSLGRNKSALEDAEQSDDYERILALSHRW